MVDNHNHDNNRTRSNVKIAFLLNFTFAIIEIIGGVLTNSTAIISDAVHDFGDSLALGTSFVLENFSKKKPNDSFTYGLKRLSLIGAFINIVVLSFGTYYVVTEAIESFVNPEPVKAMGMLALAVLGIVVNGFSVFRMKGVKKILDKTVIMHLMEDLLGWIAVFVVSIVIYFTQWYRLDAVLSLCIAMIIIKNIYQNSKNAVSIIMQENPDKELYQNMLEGIRQINGVNSIIESNLWTLDGEEHVFTAKVSIYENDNSQAVLASIKSMLNENELHASTVELVIKQGSCSKIGESP